MQKASELNGQNVHVKLLLNVPLQAKIPHPNGAVQLNRKMAEMVTPLLMSLPFIQSVSYMETPERCEYDFDLFRMFHNYTGHISQWYFHIYPELTCDLSKPLNYNLKTIKPVRPIILNRTERYHNPSFDYTVLRPYQHLITFVGVESEYKMITAKLPDITYTPVKDFKELAQLIRGAELFIGNQSMAFAIAETMKTQRILEICPFAHNVIPTGENGYGCYTVLNLIKIINSLYGKSKEIPSNG